MYYIPELDRWTCWSDTKWSIAQFEDAPLSRLRKELRCALAPSDGPQQRKRIGSLTTIKAVHALMKSNPGAVKSLAEWDSDPFMLGTPGGVVDLRSGNWRCRLQSDYLLKSTSVDPGPDDEKPPQWLSFLDKVLGGDQEKIEFIQRLLGYGLTGSTKEHRLFLAYGTGRNGKSTLFNTFCRILSNDYSRTISPKVLLNKNTEQHSTDLAYLKGARFARASELPQGKTWDEVLIKQITGGDPLTARYMRQDNFTFEPQCTLLVDANNVPNLKSVDEAIRRRICVIPFNVTITPDQEDKDLNAKLMSEAGAILRWAIQGAVKWQRSGLQIPQSIAEQSANYFEEQDLLARFIADCLTVDPDAKVSNEVLRSEFFRWSQEQGVPAWSTRVISDEMLKHGYSGYKSNNRRGFRGLKLVPKLPGL